MFVDHRSLVFERATVVCLAVVIFALAGCSNGDQPELGIVTGKVTLDGEPLKKVEVAFIPEKGRPSYGETDDEGNYGLTYIRDIQGAKIGDHKVMIKSGKVDHQKIAPVTVAAGNNVIDIECERHAKPVAKPKGVDDDES